MPLLKEIYGPFDGLDPGMVGLGGRESMFTRLKTEKMIAEKQLARHLLGIQQSLEEGELGNAHWVLGTENPADGRTKVRSDMVPSLRLLESDHFNPGSLRP